MRKSIPLLLAVALLAFSCRKFIEKKQRDVLVEAITSGAWVVEKFLLGVEDQTAEFSTYEFLFSENGSVTARSGTTNIPGTWTGNIQTYQITATFPSATDPIRKLSGTWTILSSTMTFVEAENGSGTTRKILHLRQKP